MTHGEPTDELQELLDGLEPWDAFYVGAGELWTLHDLLPGSAEDETAS